MQRKVMAGIVVGIACMSLLAAPVASATPGPAGTEVVKGWTAWLAPISLAIETVWHSLIGPAVEVAGTKEEVQPDLSVQDGDSCTDPTTTWHGCVVDPDG